MASSGGNVFCSQCGASADDTPKVCPVCGAPLSRGGASLLGGDAPLARGDAITAPVAGARSQVRQIRPWVRYWARTFDIYLFGIVLGIVLSVPLQGILTPALERLLGLLIVFLWVFVEALLLSTGRTTPGKWLLKTRVVALDGQLSYSKALARSFSVWWRGMGIGFPLTALIALLLSYRRLNARQITWWDEDVKTVVVHERIGPVRAVGFIVVLLTFFTLVLAGSLPAEQ
jgi:uncharacterized RDD family membrane protein YckC